MVPPQTDIEGYRRTLMDWDRLFASELYNEAQERGLEGHLGLLAAILLWGKSTRQTPPGSLPNDEKRLARMIGAAVEWEKIRDLAMHGWIECSDGRLYHAVVAENVRNAAKAKKDNHERTKAATAARQAKRLAQALNGHANAVSTDEETPL